jgi:hypothetical protein
VPAKGLWLKFYLPVKGPGSGQTAALPSEVAGAAPGGPSVEQKYWGEAQGTGCFWVWGFLQAFQASGGRGLLYTGPRKVHSSYWASSLFSNHLLSPLGALGCGRWAYFVN